MTFKEARKYSEQMLAGVEVKEVRRRAWPDNFEGIFWDEASAKDRKATDWYIVGEDVPILLGQVRPTVDKWYIEFPALPLSGMKRVRL